MPTWSDTLFYVVFLGQIFLISHYFPARILRRMTHILETYPPTEYPKLYPRPLEYYRMGQIGFRIANRLIMALGFAVLLSIMFLVDHGTFADDGFISEAWPAAYGIVQFVPLIALEFSELSQLRLMRKIDAATTRTAQLRPRRLFDYVSPVLVAAAAVLFVASIVFDLAVHGFTIEWGHDTVQRAAVLTGTNAFLGAVAIWLLHGRKPNPHQSSSDRARQIAAGLHSFFYVSIVMSVFFAVQAAEDLYDFAFLEATLISFYYQVVVMLSIGQMLRSAPLEDIDFEVYRETPASA